MNGNRIASNERKTALYNSRKIRWEKSANNKLFHQLLCEGFNTVQSEQLGLLNVNCKVLENDFPNKEIVLDPSHNLGQLQGMKLIFNHSLHNSSIGNGEDVLQGILTLKNEGNNQMKLKVSFTTSAQLHQNTEEVAMLKQISKWIK